METIDFLKQNIRQIKKSIKDIDDSYNNEWDILSELCQNSIDAIRKQGNDKGKIQLHIDSQNKIISIIDNGCGIVPDRLPILLAPFSTDKEEDENSIGEKGVGLTFVIFSCNKFYIKSGNSKGTSEGKIFDAFSWKTNSNNDSIELHHNILDEKFQGTLIELKEVSSTIIFQLSFNQLRFLLRNRTAFGNTNTIWDKDIDVDIELTHTNQDGKTNKDTLKFGYWLPVEGYNKQSIISIEEYDDFIKADKTDKQKRDKLFGKIIYKKGVFEHRGRSIKYWSCFVPQRKTWNDISLRAELCTNEQLENGEWLEQYNFALFHSGIFTSVKGMPTGVLIDNPITGSQSYWAQIFILFEDRQIKFDIGRKALPGSQSRIYKTYAKSIFNEYARLFKYVGRNEVEEKPEWLKNQVFAEIEKELDLNIEGMKFQKNPAKQEASVAGIFYECIGNGKIKNIIPLSSGYKSKYDLYAKWGERQIVIEFKSKLSNVLNDFNDEKKMFDELDCIVCWNVDEEDYRTFKSRSIELEEVEESELIKTSSFPNATHKLILPYVDPIYIIDLKRAIK